MPIGFSGGGGGDGGLLTAASADNSVIATVDGTDLDISRQSGLSTYYRFWEFETAEHWTSSANSGAIALTVTNNTNANPGIIQLRTSTSASAAPSLTYGTTGAWIFGAGKLSMEFLILIENLSDETETYTARLGFGDSFSSAANVDGAWFEYTDGVNSGNWQCKTSNSSSVTTENTSTAAVAAAWRYFRVEGNAAGTSVTFYIGETKATAALVATIATNIPTGAARGFCPFFQMVKSVGTTQRIIYCDAAALTHQMTTGR